MRATRSVLVLFFLASLGGAGAFALAACSGDDTSGVGVTPGASDSGNTVDATLGDDGDAATGLADADGSDDARGDANDAALDGPDCPQDRAALARQLDADVCAQCIGFRCEGLVNECSATCECVDHFTTLLACIHIANPNIPCLNNNMEFSPQILGDIVACDKLCGDTCASAFFPDGGADAGVDGSVDASRDGAADSGDARADASDASKDAH